MNARTLVALAAGTLFGAGLAVSGMIDPARVRGFLDLFGPWDPTLAFVMAGALLPMSLAWRIVARRAKPVAEREYHLPDPNPITPRLLGGSVVFGVGWGIAGLCPGPAIADLALRPAEAAPFVAAMIAGFALQHFASMRPRATHATSLERSLP